MDKKDLPNEIECDFDFKIQEALLETEGYVIQEGVISRYHRDVGAYQTTGSQFTDKDISKLREIYSLYPFNIMNNGTLYRNKKPIVLTNITGHSTERGKERMVTDQEAQLHINNAFCVIDQGFNKQYQNREAMYIALNTWIPDLQNYSSACVVVGISKNDNGQTICRTITMLQLPANKDMGLNNFIINAVLYLKSIGR